MKWYEKIWDWMSGKKTAIGIASHVGLIAFSLFSKQMTFKESWVYHGYISTLTGVGFFHKLGKTEKGKEITKKITDAAKKATSKDKNKP